MQYRKGGKQKLIMESKRGDVRVNDELEVKIETIFEPSGAMVQARYDISMLITNISASGLMLESDREFEVGTSFKFYLPLEEEEPIDVMVEVVRKMYNEKEEKYTYGCKFEHLEAHFEQSIRKYVFSKELSKRRMNERKY